MRYGIVTILAVLITWSVGLPRVQAEDGPPSVFELPRIQATLLGLRMETQGALRGERFDDALKFAARAIDLVPFDLASNYDLARAHAGKGNRTEAIESLRKVISLGLPNNVLLKSDPHFDELRELPEFAELMELAGTVKSPVSQGWKWDIQPTAVAAGVAQVSESNTGWDSNLSAFNTYFSQPDKSEQPIIRGHGAVGDLLRSWYAAGTAAGNHGDLYDNHDADHSIFDCAPFPQLTRIQYDEIVRQREFHTGLQNWFFYNAVVFGNSSTAITNTPMWRSQARLAYTDRRSVAILHTQYRRNQLYVYPEHHDHDAGHNGRRGGYGDVFPANTPYTIISQGSSFSDRPFLDAVACTLAAFHPDVKQSLVRRGLLMPTVQMILRRCYREVNSPSDYLTGRAHPTVFDGDLLNVDKMVRLAHKIKLGEEPPHVQLRVVEEDQPVPGRDYFHTTGEKLFDTPCAIARVVRSTKYWRRMVVSAEESLDINNRPLRFRWAVLRGDKSRVQIKRLNENGSRVELRVAYHERRWIRPLAGMHSNRVDIGAIVDNGAYFSAPAFISFFGLDNERRVYEGGLIKSVRYTDVTDYVDPFIDRPKRWVDEYHHDQQGQLLGWTRIRGQDREEFTAEGALVLERDDLGRTMKAQTVTYGEVRGDNLPILKQQLGNEVLFYEYGEDDGVGKVVRKKSVSN